MSDQAKKCVRCDAYLAESDLGDLCLACRKADEPGKENFVLRFEILDKLLDLVKTNNDDLAKFKDEAFLHSSSNADKLVGALRLGQVLAFLDVCDVLTGTPVVLGKRLEDQVKEFSVLGVAK